jgi:hypothetical protein
MKKLVLMLAVIMAFAMVARAQETPLPEKWAELLKIHNECLVKFGHEFMKDGDHFFHPCDNTDDKAVSVYILKHQRSSCKRVEGKVIYHMCELQKKDENGLIMNMLIKVIQGEQVKTIGYIITHVQDRDSVSTTVALNTEVMDRISVDTECLKQCGIQYATEAGKCLLKSFFKCWTDWKCYYEECKDYILNMEAVQCALGCIKW